MSSERTRDMIAQSSGNALALERIAYRLESSLAASQERVAELERDLQVATGLGSCAIKAGTDWMVRAETAERERDEAVARAEEAEGRLERRDEALDACVGVTVMDLEGTEHHCDFGDDPSIEMRLKAIETASMLPRPDPDRSEAESDTPREEPDR